MRGRVGLKGVAVDDDRAGLEGLVVEDGFWNRDEFRV
jgi:hypothetical protein